MIKIWMKESWGLNGMMIFPFILINKKFKAKMWKEKLAKIVNHEKIHFWQCLEMLIIPFYLWYGVEYLIGRVKFNRQRDAHNKAYRNISFEKEAYQNDLDPDYLATRKLFAFTKYL